MEIYESTTDHRNGAEMQVIHRSYRPKLITLHHCYALP